MTAKLTSYMVIPLGKELKEISFYIEVVAGDAGVRKSGIIPPGFRSGVKGMPEVAKGKHDVAITKLGGGFAIAMAIDGMGDGSGFMGLEGKAVGKGAGGLKGKEWGRYFSHNVFFLSLQRSLVMGLALVCVLKRKEY